MSQEQHKAAAPLQVRCFVLTVSDTRTDETDTSGRAIAELIESGGHVVTGRTIVRDEPAQVADLVLQHASSGDVDVVITTGGTGITSRDSTYEAITALLDKQLDGFGEIFRMLSYHDIGAAAMLSRACAGVRRGVVIAALPGSEGAVRLAMSKLLLPELRHLVQQARK